LEGAMTEQHKKRFFEHWITAYCNRLDEVARNKKMAAAKLPEDSLKEIPHSTSPVMDLQPKPHTMSAEAAAKTSINRSHQ
jgi:hypothetical protein